METARALVDAGAERVYLAGRPAGLQGELEAAGVDQFIHVGVDLLDVLGGTHELLGIPPVGAPPATGATQEARR
ncbi:MAG: hypothetical protein M5U19_00430 [Microthrixaceae bacterium]|nr:hypothetical protein [Microthrixaceae bacterium]